VNVRLCLGIALFSDLFVVGRVFHKQSLVESCCVDSKTFMLIAILMSLRPQSTLTCLRWHQSLEYSAIWPSSTVIVWSRQCGLLWRYLQSYCCTKPWSLKITKCAFQKCCCSLDLWFSSLKLNVFPYSEYKVNRVQLSFQNVYPKNWQVGMYKFSDLWQIFYGVKLDRSEINMIPWIFGIERKAEKCRAWRIRSRWFWA